MIILQEKKDVLKVDILYGQLTTTTLPSDVRMSLEVQTNIHQLLLPEVGPHPVPKFLATPNSMTKWTVSKTAKGYLGFLKSFRLCIIALRSCPFFIFSLNPLIFSCDDRKIPRYTYTPLRIEHFNRLLCVFLF